MTQYWYYVQIKIASTAKQKFVVPISNLAPTTRSLVINMATTLTIEEPAAKRPRLAGAGCGLLDLTKDLRLHILEFSSHSDLGEFACVSKQCREDSQHSSLPQERWACIHVVSLPSFLIEMNSRQRFKDMSRFRFLKILNPSGIERVNAADVRRILRTINLPFIRLDISLPDRFAKRERKVHAAVPKVLSKALPHLVEVDMTNCIVTQSAVSDFASNCARLERFIWHDCLYSSIFASGQDFKKCQNLKELYMDNATLYMPDNGHVDALLGESPECFLLCLAMEKVKRLSVKEVHYKMYGEDKRCEVLQDGLMKIVKHAPCLRWLRSDLTTENIVQLKLEHPDVTFVN
jgi:hypothetical protein